MAKKKRNRRNREDRMFSKKNIISIFIVVLMIMSVFGVLFYGYNESAEQVEDTGLKFSRSDNFWKTKIDGKEMEVDYLPSEVSYITVDDDVMFEIASTAQIDTTSQMNGSLLEGVALANYRLQQNLVSKPTYVRIGSIYENEFDLPIIKCDEVVGTIPTIYFKEGDELKVYKEGNCIIAQGASNSDFMMIANRLVYGILGVL